MPVCAVYSPSPLSRDRGDAAALDQRQIHPYQIRHAAAYAHAAVRLLRQPAAVYQGALPPLLGEQDPRAVGFLRRPHAVVFPGEVTAGEILVSTFPPNLPLPALRAASVAAPRHPASGCARLTTRVTKGGFSRHPHAVVFPSETTAGEIRFPTYTNHPPAKRRDLPLPQLPSHQRTTTRGKAKKRSERLFFRTKRPIFIPKVS